MEICLKNKIIYDFLHNYKKKKWTNIIRSLLEIAIINLYTSFKRNNFSEEDLSIIIETLKLKYYRPKLLISNNMKSKKQMNINKNETIDIDILKFRNNLRSNLQDYLNETKHSYRSYSKKAKNINELNIYNINENKTFHYSKERQVTPIKRLINYNETEVSQRVNEYKNILNTRHIKSNFNSIDKNNRILDYFTVENSDPFNNTYQTISNTYKNNHQKSNYSFSIDFNNPNYIKVNKNNSKIKINENRKKNTIEKGYLTKKENNYYENNDKEKTAKNNKIKRNKFVNNNLINNVHKKYKTNFNLFAYYNKKPIPKKDETKNSINLSKTNYYKERRKLSNLPNNINYSLFQNSPKRRNTEFKVFTKLQQYKIGIVNSNQTSVKRTNLKEKKSMQFSNIKKNIKAITLRNLLNKERTIENNSNLGIKDDINNINSNINDINYSRYSKNLYEKGQSIINGNNNRKKVINYNSFIKYKNEKKGVFLNDPLLF